MCTTCNKKNVVRLYDEQAKKYARMEKKKGFDYNWRKKLLSKASGDLLEVSVGAGANFKFYPKNVKVTAIDISKEMIREARLAAYEHGISAHFICAPVEDVFFESEKFDTVVSTLSLCAYADPVETVRKMKEWCKPGGKLLFLEHGLAKPKVARWLQNKLDGFQYRKIGCHANRDILQIIEATGLQVQKVERKVFGMIYIVECKP